MIACTRNFILIPLLFLFAACSNPSEPSKVTEEQIDPHVIEELRERFEISAPFIESEALMKSKQENKPLFLYFTGWSVMSSRRWEERLFFSNPRMAHSLLNNFVFIPIYVDDKIELPKEMQTTEDIDGRKKNVRTVGDLNTVYQLRKTESLSQPLVLILNSDGVIIKKAFYRDLVENDFETFLEDALDGFGT